MRSALLAAADPSVRGVVAEFVRDAAGAAPDLLAGLIFVTLAYLVIQVVQRVVREVLGRAYADDQQLIVDLIVTVVSLFMWFAAGLALLKIVGMGEIAASLGTATGFIALGIAFALKEMIADTVAGVYLLRDPDFHEGDFVTTASVTGTVVGIDLRKTRIETEEGDLVVLANREVEKKWTREAPDPQEEAPAEAS